MRIAITYHSLPVHPTDMLSYNQQGFPGANMVPVNAFGQQWATGQPNWVSNQVPQFIGQNGYWRQPMHHQMPQPQPQAHFPPSNQFPVQYQPKYQFNPANAQVVPSPMQINQFNQPRHQSTPVRPHQARISLVPNASGGFKAVVKRKRKRTHFTTEQIEAMETVFQKKPYVTREDRQVIVQQLQLNDTAVKVWFQNRRLRGKRAAEEAAAEHAMYEEETANEQSYYNYADHQESIEFSRPEKMLRLDVLESELSRKVDEFGYIALDEKSIGDIVDAIDNTLSLDINLDFELPSSASEDENRPSIASSESVVEHSDLVLQQLSNSASEDENRPSIATSSSESVLENFDLELLPGEDSGVDTQLSGSSYSSEQIGEDLQVGEVTNTQLTGSSSLSELIEKDFDVSEVEVTTSESPEPVVNDVAEVKPVVNYVEVESVVDDVVEIEPEVNDVVESSISATTSYELISPAGSPASDTINEENLRWEQFAPEHSLQQLFDLHFC